MFLTQSDHKDALKLGIIDLTKPKDEDSDTDPSGFGRDLRNVFGASKSFGENIAFTLFLPEKVSKGSYDQTIKKLMVWNNYLDPAQTNSYSSREKGHTVVKSGSLREVWTKINIATNKRDPFYKIKDSTYILDDSNRTMDLTIGTIGYFYYFMKAEGISDLKQYITVNNARKHHFKSTSDYEIAASEGFTDSGAYYDAIEKGFSNYTDYNNARKMEIESFDSYKQYKKLIAEFSIIQSKYNIKPNQGYTIMIIKVLQDQKPGEPVSLTRIVNDFNNLGSQYYRIGKLREYSTRSTNNSNVKTWFDRNIQVVNSLGSYSSSDFVFTLRN